MAMITGVNDLDIQSFEIEDNVISDEQAVGSFNLNTAKIKLVNVNKQYDNLKGTWLETVFGSLYVKEAKSEQGDISIELECYDLAYKFDKEYSPSGYVFPMTVEEWLELICQQAGVTLATTTFPNSDLSLDHQPYLADGASLRDAVREVAGSAGCFAQIIDDELHIKWFDNTTTTADDWFELTQGEQVPAVNTVVLGRGDLEDNIIYPSPTPENPYELRIDDNQILLDHEQDTIEPIYDNVVGFQYHIFKLRFIGLRNLRAGQKISYTDIDGASVTTPVMSHKIKFLGGDYTDPNAFESEVESVQLKETNTTYKYAGTITKTVKRTEARVDKTEGDIQLITEDIQQVWDEFGNYYTTGQSNELVQNAVDGLMNTFSNSGGNNLIRNSSLFFGEENNYDYWDGDLLQVESDLSASKKALLLKAGTVEQALSGLVAGYVSLRFSYKRVGTGIDVSAKCMFDGNEYPFEEEEGTIEVTEIISSGATSIAFEATDSDEYIVYDLMLNYGQGVYLPYQQAQNELRSTQVSISQEIKVESNTENTITTIGANGLVGRNKSTEEVVFKQTDTGSYSKHIETESAKISDLIIQKVGDQVWITGT